ncbi:MAG: hypothetical protein J3Q66DRAFT_409126 [Benniella sp.]|nr:MAG: hypothetical protein J3Q66DRAFT_409126 [Benniella sp.]
MLVGTSLSGGRALTRILGASSFRFVFLPHLSSFRLILPVSTLSMPPAPKNPLVLPEILKRMSRYVTTNDAVSCAQVCKAWSNHFASIIWHTIDFDIHHGLIILDIRTLAKYGHYIRVVENISEHSHIITLTSSNARRLERLSITMSASQKFYDRCVDLLRQVNTTLEHIDIFQPKEYGAPYFAVDSLFPAEDTNATSRLSSIKIRGLRMTRDSLSSLLENCPSLEHLNIRDTTLLSPLHDTSDTHYYRHTGVIRLTAPIEQVCKMDQQSEIVPSLFVQFPNLQSWITRNSHSRGAADVSSQYIRDEVAKHCPSLKALSLGTRASTTIGMLARSFEDLTEICIKNKQLSNDMVTAILKHQETLKTVMTFVSHDDFYDSETIPDTESIQDDTNGGIIQSIPQHCTRLETLQLPLFEMDMDDVEKTKWGCRDLEELHIRVRGLDTEQKIDRAIQLWKEGRMAIKEKRANCEQESPSASLQVDSAIPPDDNSIEARVARHLLKLENLRKMEIDGCLACIELPQVYIDIALAACRDTSY